MCAGIRLLVNINQSVNPSIAISQSISQASQRQDSPVYTSAQLWVLPIILRASEAAAQCIVIAPVCGFVGVFVSLWVCYHENSKSRASILTKLGLQVKVVTISSWLNFGRPVCGGAKISGSALLQPARSVCVSSERFILAPMLMVVTFSLCASVSLSTAGYLKKFLTNSDEFFWRGGICDWQ